ncbi:hypothetical protein B0H14DRAFT_3462690 [Mycena olivaceomarginata]|nr:hypothetical protein B0H14DRAFT_3462690 [Mycena olivaceomarginata]
MKSPLLHRPYDLLLHEEDQCYRGQSVSPSANFGLRPGALNGAALLSSLARSSSEGDLLVSPILDPADSENSKMNPIVDISAIPVSSSPSLLNREPETLNTHLSCEWKWNPDTQEMCDAGGTSWAENTASPMEIITQNGEYDSEPLAPPTTATAQSLHPPARISSPILASLLIATFNMRKPGAAISPLSPTHSLNPYTALQAPPPIELQYLEGDVDTASARYVSLADLTGPPSHDGGESVSGRSNSRDGAGRGRVKAANHRNTGSAADALRVITELSLVRTGSNGPLKAASETPNPPLRPRGV